MLHFDKNPNTKKEFELVKEGRYETILTAEWGKDFDGSKLINCVYKIRKDVEQEFQGRVIFDKIKADKNGVFHTGKINSILAAIPDAQSDFETYDDLIQYFNDKLLNIEVTILKANPEYPNSKDKNSVKYYTTTTTQFPEYKDVKKEVSVEITKPSANLPQIDEDSLPF